MYYLNYMLFVQILRCPLTIKQLSLQLLLATVMVDGGRVGMEDQWRKSLSFARAGNNKYPFTHSI